MPPHHGVASLSFVSLLVVQFCTALNDHTFRWLVVPVAKPLLGDAAALSLGLAGFTLPFLFLATPAGFFADRYSKAWVIRICKLVELFVLVGGLLALCSGQSVWLFIVVAATGALAALFSPAKIGSIPEYIPDRQLATANGWMGLANVVPCALGFLLGNWLAGMIQPTPETVITLWSLLPAAALIVTVALIGWGASFGLTPLPAAAPTRTWTWNLAGETYGSLKLLVVEPVLMKTALGIAFFWMMASLANINIDTFGIHDLGLKQRDIGILGMVLVIGVGAGSVLAGWWSAGRIELGLVPLGAAGISACALLLSLAGSWGTSAPTLAFYTSCAGLLGLGMSAGLFDVPLEAFLQYRSPPQSLGRVLAATNFLVFSGTLLIAAVFYGLNSMLGLSAGTIFLLAGLGTIAVGIYIAWQLPLAMFRFLFWVFATVAYRIRVTGKQHVPKEGGVLLVPNHVTWVDGILLTVVAPRPVRFIAYADFVHHPRLAWLAKVFDVIPIKADGGPKALIQSLKVAREALEQGSCVCIFPEGTLTRTGQTQRFQPGFLKILQGTNCPAVPVRLHGLWGSIFSYRGGKFFWKWPRKWPYPVSVLFGPPIQNPQSVEEVERVVSQLGAEAVEMEKSRIMVAPRQFLRASRRRWSQLKVADSLGTELTGGRLLIGALALRKAIGRNLNPATQEPRVGIYLPSTVGGALANLALSLMGRVSVNLNYTLHASDIRFVAKDAGLQHVITSRSFVEKKPLELDVPCLYLEDLKQQMTGLDKGLAAIAARVVPLAILERWLGLTRIKPDDPITIIYTSGSTGEPKGVTLTHYNIAGTVDAADQVFQVDEHDTLLGVLPIFHSFGYLATFWLPLMLDARVIYHPNPLDSRQIGELAEKYGATILFATPTFLRSYLKRCTKEQFSKLNLVVVGAEKLPADLAEQFQEKYGFLPQEGYGTTETSGPACVNVPDHRSSMVHQMGTKLGTVGKPMPGVVARIVDVDTGAELPTGKEGLVYLRGQNIMAGYFQRPEKTAEVLKDGWYNTGDMGSLDADGFLKITGRMSRFSKIGGEMVPHLRIEEELLRVAEAQQADAVGPILAVTSVPDAKKGERIIVLHQPLKQSASELIDAIGKSGLPNLWLPSADSFYEVPQVPLLGTGKLDLRATKQCALELASGTTPA